MPIPQLEFLDENEAKQPIVPNRGRPLFVTLWASWCPACDASFTNLAENVTRLEKAGIDTLALSVNGLGEGDQSTHEGAKAYLKKHTIPLSHQRAHPDLLHQLQLIANRIIAQNELLPPSFRISVGSSRKHYCLLSRSGTSRSFGYHGKREAFQSTLSLPCRPPLSRHLEWRGKTHPVSKLVSDFIEADFSQPGLAC